MFAKIFLLLSVGSISRADWRPAIVKIDRPVLILCQAAVAADLLLSIVPSARVETVLAMRDMHCSSMTPRGLMPCWEDFYIFRSGESHAEPSPALQGPCGLRYPSKPCMT